MRAYRSGNGSFSPNCGAGRVVPALAAAALAFQGAAPSTAADLPQSVKRPAAPAAAAPRSQFEAQASRLGARKCLGLFAELGQRATQGSSYGVQVEANKTAPDAHALQGVAGMTYNQPEIRGSAASVVLAAPTADGCQGNMVRVAPFQKPCQEVVRLLPPGSTAAGDLAGVPLYNVPQTQDRILLIANSAASCVVVSVNQASTSG